MFHFENANKHASMDAWMTKYALTLRGARWGDLEVYTIEENLEILAKPSRKETHKLVTIIDTVRTKKNAITVTVGLSAKKKKTFAEQLAAFKTSK